MNLVVISDSEALSTLAPDSVSLVTLPSDASVQALLTIDNDTLVIEPPDLALSGLSDPAELAVSLNGIPGPSGAPGSKGDKGDTGSLGDVHASAPLYYSPATNTIYLDTSSFETAGAANLALQAAKDYVDAVSVSRPLKYVHNQISSSQTWNVLHNLNTKPSVTIVDSANQDVFGDITYDSLNSLTLTFTVPFSGTAYFI